MNFRRDLYKIINNQWSYFLKLKSVAKYIENESVDKKNVDPFYSLNNAGPIIYYIGLASVVPTTKKISNCFREFNILVYF